MYVFDWFFDFFSSFPWPDFFAGTLGLVAVILALKMLIFKR